MDCPFAVLDGLREAVERLAQPPAAQSAYLASIDTAGLADELALEFYDLLQLAPQLVEAGACSPSAMDLLKSMDTRLHEMSGQPQKWTAQALFDDADRASVRALAQRAPDEMQRTRVRRSARPRVAGTSAQRIGRYSASSKSLTWRR